MGMTMRTMVLDIETQKGFNEVDRKKLHLLKVSVACVYDSKTDSYLSFEEKEMLKLEELLKQADLVVGFEKVRGHRISLQILAQATLQTSKSGSGWDAIQLYKDGKMDELKKYCIDDVRLTRDVYLYGLKNKKIHFVSNRGIPA